ncbi:MAG: glycosyltransferase family 4 protein [bacterium]
MTILEACFSPALGGLELYCLNTARQLQQRGHKVLLWLRKNARMSKHPLAQEVGCQTFREPGYLAPLFSFRAQRLIQRENVEVIHLHRSRDLASFALLNAPKLLTLQIESSLKKRDALHRFVYARVNLILTITDRMRKLACQTLPVEPERIQTLHYGIDADRIQQASGDPATTRQRLGIPMDAFVVGLLGRLEPSKGQHILLQALQQLDAAYPQLHVLIVGEAPPEKPNYDQILRQQAANLNVTDRVHFIDFQPQPEPIYAILDAFVLASKKESFGLVLLEAMAAGVPIIATEAGGVPEIIENGVNGLLIPPEDPDALAQQLRTLIEDSDLRCRLTTNGKRIVIERFNIERHLNALEAHFREIIRRKAEN